MVQELFLKLVNIASPSGNEGEMGKFIAGYLNNLGLSSLMDKEGNVLARTKGNGKGTPCLISAHLDTVQGITKVKPVKGKKLIKSSGDTILGADNKASVSAILSALENTKASKRKNLEMVFSVREETDGGVSKMDLNWLKSKEGIVADSGEAIGSIICETPFIEGFEIEIIGKSSHSSEPEYGVNALSLASHAINGFNWGKVDELSSANIGLIEGGSAVNTTPGRIYLKGEIRSYRKANLVKIKNDLEILFKSAAKIYRGKVLFNYQYYCDGYALASGDAPVNGINKIYKKLNIKGNYRKSMGGSDANFFNSKGICVVNIGDGVNNPHTNKEFISISDLNLLTHIFSNYIQA